MIQAIRNAHSRGKKLYLTVNTLMKNREMDRELFEYLAPYYEAGLDAVIVQDLGVDALYSGSVSKAAHSHQYADDGNRPECMRFFAKQKSVDRIVPARELSLQELRGMREAGPLDLETFIHGALCYSYSGQCLFSSVLGEKRKPGKVRAALPAALSGAGRAEFPQFPERS